MIGWIATARTFLSAFKGPCLILAVSVGLAAFGAGIAAARWHYRGDIAELKLQIANERVVAAEALADAATRNVTISNEVTRHVEQQNATVDALAADVRGLRRDVRVCASTSTMRIPGAASEPDRESGSGQPRPAEAVLSELAERIAERCDKQAHRLNGLIDWFAKVRAEAK